jgi:hypothetical protein
MTAVATPPNRRIDMEKKRAKSPGRPAMPKTVLAKLELDVVQQARAVCPLLGRTMSEYLSAILRPVLSRDLAEALAKLQQQTERPGRPRG